MLIFKHRATSQEKEVHEDSQQAKLYTKSPAWVLITPEIEEELKQEEFVRVDSGKYTGLKKQQLKSLLDERHVTYNSRDNIKILISKLDTNDTVSNNKQENKELAIEFTDNLI